MTAYDNLIDENTNKEMEVERLKTQLERTRNEVTDVKRKIDYKKVFSPIADLVSKQATFFAGGTRSSEGFSAKDT